MKIVRNYKLIYKKFPLTTTNIPNTYTSEHQARKIHFNCPKIYIGQKQVNWTYSSTPLTKSNFAELITSDFETNLNILHSLRKDPKLNTTEQYDIYICAFYKKSPNILNDHLHYKTHILFDTTTHACHTNISAIPILMNCNSNTITVNSIGPVKHW